jgi:TRAP-type C4-dicarboxylate transport system permease small subunit
MENEPRRSRETPSPLLRAGTLILDIVELYCPAATFLVLFVVFNVQIFYRYVLDNPLSWTTEVSLLAFVWTALLGACYQRRHNAHIVFDMIFEHFSFRGKQLAIITSNLVVGGACVVSIKPTIDYLVFMNSDHTPMLQIPFSIGFAPVLVLLVLVTCYSIRDLTGAVRAIRRGAA